MHAPAAVHGSLLGTFAAALGALLLGPALLFAQAEVDRSLQVPFIPGRVHVESSVALSGDGRRLAFAAGLDATGAKRGVYVFDRELGLRLASLDADGQELAAAELPALSADGHTLVFRGQSAGAGDDSDWDLYVRDLQGASTRVLRARELAPVVGDETAAVGSVRARYDYPHRSLALSADGRVVALEWTARSASTGQERRQLLVHELASGRTERVDVGPAPLRSAGNAPSRGPLLSADGRFVAFSSLAANLVEGDHNGSWDAFVRDRRAGSTRLESVTDAGAPLPPSGSAGGVFATGFTPDGRFLSLIANLDLPSGQPLAAVLGPRSIFVRDRDRALSQSAIPPFGAFPILLGNCDPGLAQAGLHGGPLSADGRLVPLQTCFDVPLLGVRRSLHGKLFDRHSGAEFRHLETTVRIDAVTGLLSYDGRVAASVGRAEDIEPGVFLQVGGVEPSRAAEAFIVFRKGADEWIANLGDPEQLADRDIQLDLAELPAGFGATLRGARISVLGVLHESHYVGAALRPNLLFSSHEDPGALGDAELSLAYERLAAGSDGWLDHWRRRLPQPGDAAAVRVRDPHSAQRQLGGDNFGGAFPFSIAAPLREPHTQVSVRGAIASAPAHPDPVYRARGFDLSYLLRVYEDGRIHRE